MTDATNNIESQSFAGSVSVGRDLTVGGRVKARGDATFNRNVYVEGWLNARNIRGAGKGLYETADKLNAAYPNPENGWYALVGNALPADIYRAWGGKWVATGQQGGEPVLELDKLKDISQSLEDEISARVAADEQLQAAIDEEVKAREKGDDDLSKALAKEIADREKAISDEVLERTNAITEAIAAEAKERSAAIDAEAKAREDADADLKDSLDGSVKTLQDADKAQEDRLLALEQSEWPLQVTLSVPSLLEYTGESVKVTASWRIERKGNELTPTSLSLQVNGQEVEVELSASGQTEVDVQKLGNTPFLLHVEADGLACDAQKTVTFALPMYFGFSACAEAATLNIAGLTKQKVASTVAGSYTVANPTDGQYLWLCVPDTMSISKVTSGGFAVPMEEASPAQTELGRYKCYRSSNAIVAGSYQYTLS